MRILHISDFHFRTEKGAIDRQAEVVAALGRSLEGTDAIDLIVFTGDLVYAGRTEHLHEASNVLLRTLAKRLGVPEQNVIFCCGNHDVRRQSIMAAVHESIGLRDNNDAIDHFIHDPAKEEFAISCRSIGFFNDLLSTFHPRNESNNMSHPLYSTHKRSIDATSIGILILNSAWCSIDSSKDHGNLLIPVAAVRTGLADLESCSIRIALVHHDLSDLKPYNRDVVEDLIFRRCDILFTGHIHKKRQSIQAGVQGGLFWSAAPATLTRRAEGTMGFTVVEVDTETLEVTTTDYLHDEQGSSFVPRDDSLHFTLPTNDRKQRLNKLRRRISDRIDEELDRANQLFLSTQGDLTDKCFVDLFVEPALGKRSKAEFVEINSDVPKVSRDRVKFEELIESTDDFIIHGPDKCGKTSLLARLHLMYLEDWTQRKVLSFVVDCKDRPNGRLNLWSKVAKYYGVTQEQLGLLLREWHLRILVDNYESDCLWLNDELRPIEAELGTHLSYIICVKESFERPRERTYAFERSLNPIYFQDISRTHLRLLTQKWVGGTEHEQNRVVEKIVVIFSQLNIPFIYWTVSLFLWIFEKTTDVNFQSNVHLIDVYIDNLLEKQNVGLPSARGFAFEDYKTYLAHLAHFLYTQHARTVYSATFREITDFTDDYRNRYTRITVPVEEIINFVVARGVLVNREEERYTFRLNGVFEYFLALFMTKDASFRRLVLEENRFLSFVNELEICAGLHRNDTDLLIHVWDLVSSNNARLFEKYQILSGPDANLKKYLADVPAVKPLTPDEQARIIEAAKPLTYHEQDEIFEGVSSAIDIQSAVHAKEQFDTRQMNTDLAGRGLLVLGRVLRNSIEIQDSKLVDEVLEYLIEASCNCGFAIINEIRLETAERGGDEVDTLLKFTEAFLPVIVQVFLHDAVGHPSFSRLLDSLIQKLKSCEESEYKLFVAFFLLIESDPEGSIHRVDELLGLIRDRNLERLVLVKLYFFLSFKAFGKPGFEKKVRDLIQKLHIRINPQTNLSALQRRLELIHKVNLGKNGNGGMMIK